MAYDFSKATTADIEKYVKSVEDQLAKTPNSPNAPEWKKYIDDGRAELKKRNLVKYGLIGAGVLFLLPFLKRAAK